MNGKSLEANAKVTHALKLALNDDFLSKITNFDSAFIVWNTLISLGEQTPNDDTDSKEENDPSDIWFMVQENDPLEINSESNFDEDENISYDDLAIVC